MEITWIAKKEQGRLQENPIKKGVRTHYAKFFHKDEDIKEDKKEKNKKVAKSNKMRIRPDLNTDISPKETEIRRSLDFFDIDRNILSHLEHVIRMLLGCC